MKKHFKRVSDLIFMLLGLSVLSVIAFYFSMVVIMVSISIINDVSESFILEESHSFDIYAIEDSGAYIISRHHVDESDRYYFIRKMNGGYKKGYVSSNKSYIYETNEQPKIVVYNEMPKKFNKLFKWSSSKLGAIQPKEYKVYIPKGSVTTDFNIDLN